MAPAVEMADIKVTTGYLFGLRLHKVNVMMLEHWSSNSNHACFVAIFPGNEPGDDNSQGSRIKGTVTSHPRDEIASVSGAKIHRGEVH